MEIPTARLSNLALRGGIWTTHVLRGSHLPHPPTPPQKQTHNIWATGTCSDRGSPAGPKRAQSGPIQGPFRSHSCHSRVPFGSYSGRIRAHSGKRCSTMYDSLHRFMSVYGSGLHHRMAPSTGEHPGLLLGVPYCNEKPGTHRPDSTTIPRNILKRFGMLFLFLLHVCIYVYKCAHVCVYLSSLFLFSVPIATRDERRERNDTWFVIEKQCTNRTFLRTRSNEQNIPT